MLDQKDTVITTQACSKLHSNVTIINTYYRPPSIIKSKKTLLEYQGLLTDAFVTCYRHGITYTDLILSMKSDLKKKCDYNLQLLSGRHMLTNQPNMLTEFCKIIEFDS